MSKHSEQPTTEQGQSDPAFILDKIREGYTQEIVFMMGEYECKCRILSAAEEVKHILAAKDALKKLPAPNQHSLTEHVMIQKYILLAGTQIGPSHYLPQETLDKLSSGELAEAYDGYKTAVKKANPKYEDLTQEELSDILADVKKKKTTTSDYSTSDLVAVGRYFLDRLPALGKEPGGS